MTSCKSSHNPIFLVGFWPDYETLFLRDIKFAEREVIILNPLKRFTHSKSHKYLPRPIRNALYLSILKKNFHKYSTATFIFQDHRLILNALLKYGAPNHSGVMLRNICDPVSKTGKAILTLQSKDVQVFSFDRADCKQYGFTAYNQFATAVLNPEKLYQDNALPASQLETTYAPSYDFCFIGKNKGRDQLLNQIKTKAETVGYSMKIQFIGNEPDDHFNRQLAYKKYLALQLDCHCIVDINQQGQQGLTLRPLEAALYQKKLLSNNVNLKNHALFHPDNILILESDTKFIDLKAFIERPFHSIGPESMQPYNPQTVFQVIVDHIESNEYAK